MRRLSRWVKRVQCQGAKTARYLKKRLLKTLCYIKMSIKRCYDKRANKFKTQKLVRYGCAYYRFSQKAIF